MYLGNDSYMVLGSEQDVYGINYYDTAIIGDRPSGTAWWEKFLETASDTYIATQGGGQSVTRTNTPTSSSVSVKNNNVYLAVMVIGGLILVGGLVYVATK